MLVANAPAVLAARDSQDSLCQTDNQHNTLYCSDLDIQLHTKLTWHSMLRLSHISQWSSKYCHHQLQCIVKHLQSAISEAFTTVIPQKKTVSHTFLVATPWVWNGLSVPLSVHLIASHTKFCRYFKPHSVTRRHFCSYIFRFSDMSCAGLLFL